MARACSIRLSAYTMLLIAAAPATNNPWFGTWQLRLERPDEKPETLVYSDAGHGAMRMVSVEDRSELVTHFDGKPARDVGAGGDGGALAISATSPVSYTWTFLKAGKPIVRGRNVLAPDRRSFTEVSWSISKPDEKKTFVYERQ